MQTPEAGVPVVWQRRMVGGRPSIKGTEVPLRRLDQRMADLIERVRGEHAVGDAAGGHSH